MASIVSSSIHVGREINSGGIIVSFEYEKVNMSKNSKNFQTGPELL